MLSIRQFLLMVALLQGSSAFTSSISRSTSLFTTPRLPLAAVQMSSDEDAEDTTPPKPATPAVEKSSMPPPQLLRTPPSPPAKRLDPLLASLTRIDPQTARDNANTPTTKIPFLGEVNMDKTLFIALPTVTFALLGIFSFFMVAMNSGDAVSNTLNDWNDLVLNPTAPQIDPNVCRGLCSTQEQDVEALAKFMNSLGGK